MGNSEPWYEKRLVGASVRDIAFDPSNKWLAACSVTEVLVFSTKNGQRVAILEHEARVVGAFFKDHETLVSVTVEGAVTEWRVPSGDKQEENRVTHLPVKLVKHIRDGSATFLVVEGKDKDKIFRLSSDNFLTAQADIPAGIPARSIAITTDFVAFAQLRQVTLKPLKDAGREVTEKNRTAQTSKEAVQFKPWCVVAMDALGDTVAATLEMGKTVVWTKVLTNGLQQRHNIQWHIVPPPGLALTSNGHVFTMGGETVLGRWKVGSTAKGTFLPRFPAAGVKLVVSDDASLVGVLCADNSLHIVLTATMGVQATAKILQVPQAESNPTVFIVDPLSPNLVVTNGKAGSLQYIDPKSSVTQHQIEISGENPGLVEAEHGRNFYDVEVAAFSPAGHLMTVEKRVNFEQSFKRIRFWTRANPSTPAKFKCLETLLDETDIRLVVSEVTTKNNDTTPKVFVSADAEGRLQVWEPWEKATRWRRDVTRAARWQTPICGLSSVSATGMVVSVHSSSGPVAMQNGGSTENHVSSSSPYLVFWDITRKRLKPFYGFNADSDVRSLAWWSTATTSVLIYSTQKSVTALDVQTKTIRWVVEESFGVRITPLGAFAWSTELIFSFEPETCRPLTSLKTSKSVRDVLLVDSDGKTELVSRCDDGYHIFSHEDVPFTTSKQETKTRNPFAKAPVIAPVATLKSAVSTVEKSRQRARLLAGPAHALPSVAFIAPAFISSCLAPPAAEE